MPVVGRRILDPANADRGAPFCSPLGSILVQMISNVVGQIPQPVTIKLCVHQTVRSGSQECASEPTLSIGGCFRGVRAWLSRTITSFQVHQKGNLCASLTQTDCGQGIPWTALDRWRWRNFVFIFMTIPFHSRIKGTQYVISIMASVYVWGNEFTSLGRSSGSRIRVRRIAQTSMTIARLRNLGR